MKNYMFPGVLYFIAEDGDFMLHIEDLNVFAYGDSVEKVQHNALDLVNAYVDLSLKIDCEIPTPTTFEEMVQKHPKHTILLVETVVDPVENCVVVK